MTFEVETAQLRRAFTRTAASQFGISDHAHTRMSERGISEADLKHAVEHGRVIEKQFHGWDFKMVVQGPRSDGVQFYVLIADSRPYTVVTVCNFDEDIWEEFRGRMRRKQRP